jgi:hypothetical protein
MTKTRTKIRRLKALLSLGVGSILTGESEMGGGGNGIGKKPDGEE